MMEQFNRLSGKSQQRIEALQSRADNLFCHQWLRKAMFDELRKQVMNRGGYPHFSEQMQEHREMMLVTEYFMSYRSTLPSIQDEYMNPYGDKDPIMELVEERKQLIDDYAKLPLSHDWDRIKEAFPDSWRAFARRLDFRNEHTLADLRQLLQIVDRISLITDILNKREGGHGITLRCADYQKHMQVYADKEMTRDELKQMLAKAIDACREYFWANTSMAVVQAICKEDYNFGDNASEFERFMQEVLLELETPLNYGCPANTIASARQSGEYLKHPISEWAGYCAFDSRPMVLLRKLRTQLDIISTENTPKA